jgi:Tfp pilus assembly protein PilX
MDVNRQDGVALLVAMMAMLMMTALGIGLVLTTTTETLISANFRNSVEGLYAADAAVECALKELTTVPDWNTLLGGAVQSTLVDGPPSGTRTLPDGTTLDLTRVVNVADCAKATCAPADLVAVTSDRPWGRNNPVWRLYAYRRFSDMFPGTAIDSSFYVVVMVGDDPSENDDNPLQDGTTPCAVGQQGFDGGCNPGSGVVTLRGEAFGPRGAHRAVEVTVAKADTAEAAVRILFWREIR